MSLTLCGHWGQDDSDPEPALKKLSIREEKEKSRDNHKTSCSMADWLPQLNHQPKNNALNIKNILECNDELANKACNLQ